MLVGGHLGAWSPAALAATEAFKAAMKKLDRGLRNPARMKTVFADTTEMEFALAPPDTPYCTELGSFDCVSGGAIINAAIMLWHECPA